METNIWCSEISFAHKFKSYYVVWKLLNCLSTVSFVLISFKSYYVVWKLQCPHKVLPIFQWFKSYYVVWKLNNWGGSEHRNTCLNRTMQYGNSRRSHTVDRSKWFKSYYVVWKRVSVWLKKHMLHQFKSYYVVWKRSYPYYSQQNIILFKSYYVVWKRRLSY